MAHARLSADEMTERATAQFREYGFEGTSLSRLAEAMEVEKASLYYRFPGGKDEIALAVATHVSRWFAANVFAPLAAEGTPEARVRFVSRRLRAFYGDGTKSCVLEAMSLRGGGDALAVALRAALRAWLDAFTRVARESGLPAALAARRAEQAVAGIEGSLVLSRVLGETKPFLRALAELPRLLTTGVPTPDA